MGGVLGPCAQHPGHPIPGTSHLLCLCPSEQVSGVEWSGVTLGAEELSHRGLMLPRGWSLFQTVC